MTTADKQAIERMKNKARQIKHTYEKIIEIERVISIFERSLYKNRDQSLRIYTFENCDHIIDHYEENKCIKEIVGSFKTNYIKALNEYKIELENKLDIHFK